MKVTTLAVALASAVSSYLPLGSDLPAVPAPLPFTPNLPAPLTIYAVPRGSLPRVEAVTDKGLMLEMIVHCVKGAAIISYSKIEHLYCGAKGCGRDLGVIARRSCD